MQQTASLGGSKGATATSRRLSPAARKVVLTLHVISSVGLFGIVSVTLALAVAAATSDDATVRHAHYTFMDTVDHALLPPASFIAAGTGILLALGTPWGLFRHYWIVAKLLLTIILIVSGALLVGTWVQQAVDAMASPATSVTGPGSTSRLLIYGAIGHLALIAMATAIGVFKPWGRIRLGGRQPRREEVR